MSSVQNICVLGSTGSIGVSTLDVIARHADRYRVFALTAHSQVSKLAQQCEQFKPQVAVVGSAGAATELQILLTEKKLTTQVMYGPQALCDVASANECDTVMAAIVGAAGLPASLAAAKAGKKVLLANKEALVMSGQLFINAIKASGAALLPIDSEHNAIFQCLPSHYDRLPQAHGIRKITLTASGGPFLNRSLESLSDVTPDEAVAHPNWVMGRKISIDSATMMNKGLEVIEAHWLFATPAEQIDVLIHPQSVIHSMVSYEDGSVLAQLGNPDMRTPIAYGLAYPERINSGVAPLDLVKVAKLNFEAPDFSRFPCLALAYAALRAGQTASIILNASNEIAVQAFLDGKIGFRMIDQIIARAMDKIALSAAQDMESILECDKATRAITSALIAS
ncbi:1-deoxy-D-xylulose-5-phosphate reductoisomerase [Undibacterium sp. Jales W-56]|uniref:1-deoxy-D-xylulose-5-phosphate reductoisomerase n=1 Tax=Undibacterium sp. Jales W-56 TaxID=2897325 RepID=UPI0021D047B3|nr:1-deoxy-D-xylulose-5-phosphate reductoisomerase [Undibacterium sp. Jales W-56]MCU6433609.1 1-deoxy-D-xylulose-5-phosphate reductoisomerase [Undibacterium sp. Jales W-56]